MEFDRKALANIIKTLCCHYGSINKFGKKVDMSPAYLSRVMKGFYKGAPSPDILRRIADGSDGLFTYIELMYICGYTDYGFDNYNDIKYLLKDTNITENEWIYFWKDFHDLNLSYNKGN